MLSTYFKTIVIIKTHEIKTLSSCNIYTSHICVPEYIISREILLAILGVPQAFHNPDVLVPYNLIHL